MNIKFTFVKGLVISVSLMALLSLSQSAAASIKVELIEPQKFRDIDVANVNRKHGYERVRVQLEKFFNGVYGDNISDSEQLVIQVTDLDLAGYMKHFVGSSGRQMRILKDLDRFRLAYNYQLKSESGEVLKQGENHIKNNLRSRTSRIQKSRYQTVSYFQPDLDIWFKQTFSE